MCRLLLAISVVLIALSSAHAADIIPSPGASPGPAPVQPDPPRPEISPTDPGIVKQPQTVPIPGSVVTPPVVDPKMSVNPDEPPKDKDKNKKGGGSKKPRAPKPPPEEPR